MSNKFSTGLTHCPSCGSDDHGMCAKVNLPELTVTDAELADYQVQLDAMTTTQLVEQLVSEVRQQATAKFGSDLWAVGLKSVPMVKATLLARVGA